MTRGQDGTPPRTMTQDGTRRTHCCEPLLAGWMSYTAATTPGMTTNGQHPS